MARNSQKKSSPNCYRYCPICGQWLLQARGITLHVKAHHPWAQEALSLARIHCKFYCRGLALSSPCRYCGLPFKGDQAKHASECAMMVWSKFLQALYHPASLQDPRRRHGLRGSHGGGTSGGSSGAHPSPNHGASGTSAARLPGPVPGSETYSVLPPSSDAGGCAHEPVPEPSRDRGPTQQVPQAEREGSRGEGATPSSRPESSPRPAPPIPRQEQAQQSRTTRQAARQPQLQDYGFRVSGDKDGATPAPAHGCPNNQPRGSCFRARRLPSQWSTVKPE